MHTNYHNVNRHKQVEDNLLFLPPNLHSLPQSPWTLVSMDLVFERRMLRPLTDVIVGAHTGHSLH